MIQNSQKFVFDAQNEEPLIIEHLNQLRADPPSFVPHLQARLDSFDGDYYHSCGKKIRSREGAIAVEEAIEFVKSQTQVPPLKLDALLHEAARAHCNDCRDNGLVGHIGSDGSTPQARVEKVGSWRGSIAENIALQQQNALDIVLHWIIDDGSASRPTRATLLNPSYLSVAVSCSSHPRYTSCAVLLLTPLSLGGTLAAPPLSGPVDATKLLSAYELSSHSTFGTTSSPSGYSFSDLRSTLEADMSMGLEIGQSFIKGAVSVRKEKRIVEDEHGTSQSHVVVIYTMGDGREIEVAADLQGRGEVRHGAEQHTEIIEVGDQVLKPLPLQKEEE